MISWDQPTGGSANHSHSRAALFPNPATRFINNHTLIERDASSVGNCPICLEDYAEDQCLRISGVAGCDHHIGLVYLQQLLNRNPLEEKRCPLCRTIWIAGTQPARYVIEPYGRGELEELALRRSIARININSYSLPPQGLEHESTASERRRPYERATSFTTATARATENYRMQRRNFDELSRDIEDIRRRAHGTSRIGSRQRSGESRPRTRAIVTPERNVEGSANTTTATRAGGRNRGTTSGTHRVHHPRLMHGENSSVGATTRWLQSLRSNFYPGATVVSEPTDLNPPVQQDMDEEMQPWPQYFTDNDIIERLVQREADLNGRDRNVSTSEASLSTREADLSAREEDLSAREADLSAREADLNAREADLNTSHAILIARETAMRGNAMIAARNANLVRIQMAEIVQLLERQNELTEACVRLGEQ